MSKEATDNNKNGENQDGQTDDDANVNVTNKSKKRKKHDDANNTTDQTGHVEGNNVQGVRHSH